MMRQMTHHAPMVASHVCRRLFSRGISSLSSRCSHRGLARPSCSASVSVSVAAAAAAGASSTSSPPTSTVARLSRVHNVTFRRPVYMHATATLPKHDFLVLGGAGLVGTQVCRQLLTKHNPRRIVVASLDPASSKRACAEIEQELKHLQEDAAKAGKEVPQVEIVPEHGNIFVPSSMSKLSRQEIIESDTHRKALLDMLFDDFHTTFKQSYLANLILTHKPNVIVDCVNTATGISYQNVFDGSNKVRDWIDSNKTFDSTGVPELETLLMSQSIPQMVHHIKVLKAATEAVGCSTYLKVNTTGTGGMGLNIPYTHSEDRPSNVLLAKNYVAFGMTGLLFLMARTPDTPIVKELKPAAMIGYRKIHVAGVKDKNKNSRLFQPKQTTLKANSSLQLQEDTSAYPDRGELRMAVCDTGENGLFCHGEFQSITAHGQMEFLTPEEIADVVLLELHGANTGRDVISAMDASVLGPTYKAGMVRANTLKLLDQISNESEDALPSVALGQLGPPELSKLLYEAYLLKECFKTIPNVLYVDEDQSRARTAEEISEKIQEYVLSNSTLQTLPTSIGIPILLRDGTTLLRGPNINIPQRKSHENEASITELSEIDRWAEKGWLDLRTVNMERWIERLNSIQAHTARLAEHGSASFTLDTYFPAEFEIGAIAGFVLNNEMAGFRVK
jgi:hypothetical protein